MILVDYSSVMHSMVHVQIKDFDENVDLIRHMIINKLRQINVDFRDKYGQMVLCFDSGRNWRKENYPFYKANRKKGRDSSKYDWTNIYRVMDEVREDIVEHFPFKTIKVEGAEADDLIGAVCELNTNPEPILIVSPDKDFVQLQRYPNVSQFSNLQKKFVVPKVSAEDDLQEKILKGDTGDGVPNVLSDDEVLLQEGVRQSKMSKKKYQALIEDPEALGTTVARRIIRNRDLVDLTRTPFHIKEEAMQQLSQEPKGNITKVMTMMTKHRMANLLDSLSDFEVRK